MKKISVIIAALAATLSLSAQTPLPNDPSVRVGKLDNGMTYFIRHNELPDQKCEFYLVSDAGAINQGEGQDGLAHFLEHMCFNGLKNLPGKQMLEYLQSIGAAFGANINAGTGVDMTSYMLNDIPLVREGVLDTCLLVMHDYSHFVLNEADEIDAERGVILEEKRTRNNAQWRFSEKSGPYIYGDSKYATAMKDLIGSEETLKNFKPETLVDFYHTWYRPDKQAVIVVGDIDVDVVEAKIKALFADIPAVENPKQLETIVIPDNDEPLIGVLTDPEQNNNVCQFFWRRPSIPLQYRNTDQAFVLNLINQLFSLVMNERFTDIVSRPDAPFINASLSSQNLIETCDALIGGVAFKNGGDKDAINAFLYEVEKVKRFGVTDAELQRAKDNIISSLEKSVQGADSRKNPEFIYPIIYYFIENEPYLEPNTELELTKTIFSQVNAAVVNQVVAQYVTDKNISIVLNGPSSVEHPSEAELAEMLKNSRTMEIEAPKAEEGLAALLDPSTVKSGKLKKASPTIAGATEWTLSNGVKVVVLPTEYKKDQVLFNLLLPGGRSLIDDDDLYPFESNIYTVVINNSGVAQFPMSTLSKVLSGKIANIYPYLNNESHGLTGSSSPKDVETALQLLYLEFTQPRFDSDEFEVALNQIRSVLPNLGSMPNFQFSKHLTLAMNEPSPRIFMLDEDVVAKSNMETFKKVYSDVLYKDAAGAVLYIVGAVDMDTLKPMVEKYVGSLPKGKKAASFIDRGERFRAGQFEDRFTMQMEAPKVSVFQLYNAAFDPTVENALLLNATKYILDMVYTDTLREEEGGTYGASVASDYERVPVPACYIYTAFDTNKEQAPALEKLAIKGIKDLAENGPSDEYFARTVEFFKAQIAQSRISNSYWLNNLVKYYRFGQDNDTELEAAINSLTKEKIAAMAKSLVESGNFTTVVMSPAE